jgi:hypothetical protein
MFLVCPLSVRGRLDDSSRDGGGTDRWVFAALHRLRDLGQMQAHGLRGAARQHESDSFAFSRADGAEDGGRRGRPLRLPRNCEPEAEVSRWQILEMFDNSRPRFGDFLDDLPTRKFVDRADKPAHVRVCGKTMLLHPPEFP